MILGNKIQSEITMDAPKVSIIIPIYNVEKYLRQCVDSVVSQTYNNTEIILVDDGSQDNSSNICEELANEYNRIKVFHKKNGGLSDARNYGLCNSTGDFVIFLDSDDYWLDSTFLQSIFEDNSYCSADIIYFDRVSFRDGSEAPEIGYSSLSAINVMEKDAAIEYLVKNDSFIISACTKFIRRSILVENEIFFEVGRLSEDFDWTMRVVMASNYFCGFDKKVYAYRLRKGSITHSFNTKHMNDLLTVVERWSFKMRDLSLENEALAKSLRGYCSYQYCILLGLLSDVKGPEKKDYLKRLKALSFLMEYCMSPKTKASKFVYNLFAGRISPTAFVLGRYVKLKKIFR